MPRAALGRVSAVLGADDPAYRVEGLHVVNPVQHLRGSFSAAGVSVVSGRLRVLLSLTAFGRSDEFFSVRRAAATADGVGVVYRRGGGLVERWDNGPVGLEQTFVLSSRPAGSGPLELMVGFAGRGVAVRETAGSVVLTGAGESLRYGGLLVSDARGRVLRSWLSVRGSQIVIGVDDRGAMYPLRVDPFVQQAVLTGSDEGEGDGFGSSVAISGSTMVVGSPGHQVGTNLDQGAVYVFNEPASGWANATQTAEPPRQTAPRMTI